MYAFESRSLDARGHTSPVESPKAWPTIRQSPSRFSRSNVLCTGQGFSPSGTLPGGDVESALDACFESLYSGQATFPLPEQQVPSAAAQFPQDWQPHNELQALNTKQLQDHYPHTQALQGLVPSHRQQHPLQQHDPSAHTPFGMGYDPPTDGPFAALHTTSDVHDGLCELSGMLPDSPSLPFSPSEDTHSLLGPFVNSGSQNTHSLSPGAQSSGDQQPRFRSPSICHSGGADDAAGGGGDTSQNEGNNGDAGHDVGLAKRRLAKRDSARRVRARKKEQLNVLGSELQELLASRAALQAGLQEIDSSLPELKHKVQATVSDTMQVQGKNEVLRMEADMLQRMAAGVKYRLQSVMGSHMRMSNPLPGPKSPLAFSV